MPRLTISVPGKTPQPYRFQLDRHTVVLGRGSENDIVIDSGSVSVKHAQMRRVKGGYELRDLGSTNGTKLDGDRCDVIRLENGLAITLGDVEFDFLLSDEEEAKIAAELHASDVSLELPSEPELPAAKELPTAPELPPVKEFTSVRELTPAKEFVSAKELPPAKDFPSLPALPPGKEAPARPREIEIEAPSSFGMGTVLWFLMLAAMAFFVGLALHFKMDTGGSLIDAIKAKLTTEQIPAGAKPAVGSSQAEPGK